MVRGTRENASFNEIFGKNIHLSTVDVSIHGAQNSVVRRRLDDDMVNVGRGKRDDSQYHQIDWLFESLSSIKESGERSLIIHIFIHYSDDHHIIVVTSCYPLILSFSLSLSSLSFHSIFPIDSHRLSCAFMCSSHHSTIADRIPAKLIDFVLQPRVCVEIFLFFKSTCLLPIKFVMYINSTMHTVHTQANGLNYDMWRSAAWRWWRLFFCSSSISKRNLCSGMEEIFQISNEARAWTTRKRERETRKKKVRFMRWKSELWLGVKAEKYANQRAQKREEKSWKLLKNYFYNRLKSRRMIGWCKRTLNDDKRKSTRRKTFHFFSAIVILCLRW